MIEELKKLSRPELIQKWKMFFKTNSPLHAKNDFLIKHIAWELQAREHGGYSVQTRKQLDKLADKMAKKQEVNEDEIKEVCKKSSIIEIKPGTKLI